MQQYFTRSFWTSTILITILLSSCKNSTSPEQTNPTGPEETTLEIISNASFNVDENQTAVGTVNATSNSEDFGFNISGGTDQDHFSIDEASGALSFATAPDFESPADANADNTYQLTIEVTVDGASASQEVSVNVSDVDEDKAPTITSNASFSMDENTTAVDTVTASDPNGDPITFSITGGTDQNQFSIDGSSGALTFASAPDFESPADANTDNIYQLTIEASDGQNSVSQNLTVSVADVAENKAPSITSNASFSIEENTTAVATVTASAPNGDPITFSITGGTDQNQFSIDGSSGALTFASAPDFESPADANTDNTYQLTIEASDGQNSVSQNLTISVTDVNENQAPTITSNASFSIEENNTSVTTVTASDPNGDDVTFSITGGTDQHQFSIDESSGALTFATAPDFENPADANADNTYQLTIEASDGQNSISQNLFITVTDANENKAPSITSIPSVGVEENKKAVHTITATDPEGDSITFSISGGADANKFSLDANSGSLTFDNVPDYESPSDANTDNVYEVQVKASDGDKVTTQDFRANVYNDPDETGGIVIGRKQ